MVAFTSKLIMLVMVFLIVGYILSLIGVTMAESITNVNTAMIDVFKSGQFLIAFLLALAGTIKFADSVSRSDVQAMDLFFLTMAVAGGIFLYGSTCSAEGATTGSARASCPWFQSLATIGVPGIELTIIQAQVMSQIWAIVTLALAIAFGLRLEKKLPKIF